MAGNANDRVLREDSGRFDPMANALRALAIDAVQKANSGHPGAPMGMAEMATALWGAHLRHSPGNPHWPDRDRFILSNGHASMLLYALLHLTGYDLPMEELKRFRQLHSKTPGHPEAGLTPGVETTTGPLGQGLTNAVGMALAEKLLGDEFNRAGHRIVDHRTYAFLGDGCLMEGISHEACSLAGVWRLNKLIALYDDNGISIDGAVAGWFRDDTAQRFAAYGWNVIGPIDGHDTAAVDRAIGQAKSSIDRPTLIVCRTTIGRGSPARAGTARSHGEPLGAEEIAATRKTIGWEAGAFEIPDGVRAQWHAIERGAAREAVWNRAFAAYRAQHPELAAEFERRVAGSLPVDFRETAAALMARASQASDAVATRKSSQQVLAALAPAVPELLGGSADLTGSNLTDFPGCGAVRGGQPGGRYINYGVREFGMAAIMNGIALHGGYLPYGGTFLTFSDYSRNAIRMAALMKLRVIHVFTHDSIGLGEDGPTHQSVEHAASLRLIPNLDVWRPCDAAETAVAWVHALEQPQRPSALLLSRQSLPAQPRTPEQVIDIQRGGYVLSDRPDARAVILATGSEVALATAAQQLLDTQGIAVRVVSLPSSTVFDRQPKQWREAVLGRDLPRIGIEAGVTCWWGQYGCVAALGVDGFGESAPAAQVYEHFGLAAHKLGELVAAQLAAHR
ncbi:transketolase [Variovorax boronicumulans]|uniref:Transketolase n=1 Tax=Variovorax boronicumulans TaxID=436515 RepID=A0AAW8E9D0_9BURK|nr:transketolase [Variovorax boronicumulans]MDP9882481.1 transketolase [Variovorax boronicumulans]MDP9927767.1 transketolase [Variovorax boronicumulans]